MTDDLNNPEVAEDELEALKNRADQMGIKYHPSIGLEKLREKVNGAVAGTPEEEATGAPATGESDEPPAGKEETAAEKRLRLQKEAKRLIRCRVTCMNPMKKEWEGEIISAGNNTVGMVKKYIPFEVEYHIPNIILNVMRERQYQTFYTVTDPRTGQKGRKGKMVPEFAIQELPPLTKEELDALAQRQAMAQGTAAA